MTDHQAAIPYPSVASIAAGLHDHHETVTVTGTAVYRVDKVTKQENPWVVYILTDGRTGITVRVLPRLFQEHRETIATIPCPDDDFDSAPARGPALTVTGYVQYLGPIPALVATTLHRKP